MFIGSKVFLIIIKSASEKTMYIAAIKAIFSIEKSLSINNKNVFNLSSINKMFTKSKIKKGFKRKIIFRKLPKILITKDTYRMGYGLMKKTSEKGLIRLVKVAAGVQQ